MVSPTKQFERVYAQEPHDADKQQDPSDAEAPAAPPTRQAQAIAKSTSDAARATLAPTILDIPAGRSLAKSHNRLLRKRGCRPGSVPKCGD